MFANQWHMLTSVNWPCHENQGPIICIDCCCWHSEPWLGRRGRWWLGGGQEGWWRWSAWHTRRERPGRWVWGADSGNAGDIHSNSRHERCWRDGAQHRHQEQNSDLEDPDLGGADGMDISPSREWCMNVWWMYGGCLDVCMYVCLYICMSSMYVCMHCVSM